MVHRAARSLLPRSEERFSLVITLRFFGVDILAVRIALSGSFELNLKRLKLELLTYCCLILEHLIEFKEMFRLVSIIIRWEQLLISLAHFKIISLLSKRERIKLKIKALKVTFGPNGLINTIHTTDFFHK